jgi:ABC-type transporter Mla maintaining outer membrane lipid asymmetry ATPase subunit MlaF
MNYEDAAIRAGGPSSTAATGYPAALGYESMDAMQEAERVWIPIGVDHRIEGLSDFRKSRLIAAVLDLKAELGWRLVLLGTEVDELRSAERTALRARVAFLPAGGGLLSSLNGWENIVLPLGIHHPARLRGVAAQIYGFLVELGAQPHALLEKLPERMTAYEKKLTGYVRILLEKPELVLIEDPTGGLAAVERAAAAKFSTVYRANCPDGTFVELEGATSV